jgi:hypothetical protein
MNSLTSFNFMVLMPWKVIMTIQENLQLGGSVGDSRAAYDCNVRKEIKNKTHFRSAC